jgi:flagellar basal body P-ring formation protein FlgA
MSVMSMLMKRPGSGFGVTMAVAIAVLVAAAPAAEAVDAKPAKTEGRAQVLVSLHADSTVRGPEIRLSEIADIRGEDPRMVERLGVIEVGRAPLPGLSRTLDQPYLKSRLRMAGVDLSQIVLDVPASVSVATASQTISASDLVTTVRETVLAARPQDAARLSIQPGSVPAPPLAVPAGRLELRVRPRLGGEWLGSVSAPVEIWINESLHRTVYVPVKIALLTEVLVAVRALPRGTPMGPGDVRIERREVGIGQDPLSDPAALIGRQAARSLSVGEMVQASFVEQPPLVKRGEVVLLTAEGRGLRAVTEGEAREDGKEGQLVRVRNLSSNREVYGQVDGPRSVRILF